MPRYAERPIHERSPGAGKLSRARSPCSCRALSSYARAASLSVANQPSSSTLPPWLMTAFHGAAGLEATYVTPRRPTPCPAGTRRDVTSADPPPGDGAGTGPLLALTAAVATRLPMAAADGAPSDGNGNDAATRAAPEPMATPAPAGLCSATGAPSPCRCAA